MLRLSSQVILAVEIILYITVIILCIKALWGSNSYFYIALAVLVLALGLEKCRTLLSRRHPRA